MGEWERGGISFKCIVYTSGIRERGRESGRGIKKDGERERGLVGWGAKFERVKGWQIVRRERNDPLWKVIELCFRKRERRVAYEKKALMQIVC